MAGEAVIRRPTLDLRASAGGRADPDRQRAGGDRPERSPQSARRSTPRRATRQLWLTPELEFVQWNPIAASPIGRNGGEVLGVFGTATLVGRSAGLVRVEHPDQGSARARNLGGRSQAAEMGRGASSVRSTEDLAGTGEALFRQHCAGCHNAPPYRRTDPAANLFGKTFIEIGRVDYRAIGTDPAYVKSLVQRLVRTNAATAQALDGQPVVPAAAYFLQTAGAIISRAMDEAGLSEQEKAAFGGFRLRPSGHARRSAAALRAAVAHRPEGEPAGRGSGRPDRTSTTARCRRLRAALAGGGAPEGVLDRRARAGPRAARLRERRRARAVPVRHAACRATATRAISTRRQGLSPDERKAIIEYLKTL